jgi:NodT family efflux transporter outer membrane factor (OMF) lipoprotein
MCMRNRSVRRRSVLRHGNISSALHNDRSSFALLTVTNPKCVLAADLAHEYGIDSSAVTRLIDRLGKRYLLTRMRSGEDRRILQLALTPEGQRIAVRIPAIFSGVLDDLLSRFTPEEARSLKSMLKGLLSNADTQLSGPHSNQLLQQGVISPLQCPPSHSTDTQKRQAMKSLSLYAPALSCRAVVTATVAALTLTGCANYIGIKSDRQMSSPAQYESNQSLPSQGGPWPSLDWASQFGDPQLPKLIAEALGGNPSIAQAQARLAKAQSYIESSRSTLLPQVTGSYAWTRERYSPNGLFIPPIGGQWDSENNILASASWDLDLWGKNRQRLGQAVSQERAAEADMQQARVTLAASVASAYNQLARLYAQRDIAQREIQNREEIGRITDGRVTAGLDTNVERQTAIGNIATTRANLSDLDGQITVVRYQLGALLGKGPDRGLQIAQPVLAPGGAVALPDNLPADLLARRPDVVAARWQVEAALHDVKEAKAEFFPDVNLSAAAGFDAFGWGRFFTAGSRQVQLGPAIHLPIFDGGALRSQLKGRYADFDYNVASYNQTLINALNDVSAQLASIHSIDRQQADAQRALDASTSAYQLSVVRYKAGLSPQLQVLSADQNRLAAEQTLTDLRMSRRNMQIGLIKALGGGFDAAKADLVVPTEARVARTAQSSQPLPASEATPAAAD